MPFPSDDASDVLNYLGHRTGFQTQMHGAIGDVLASPELPPAAGPIIDPGTGGRGGGGGTSGGTLGGPAPGGGPGSTEQGGGRRGGGGSAVSDVSEVLGFLGKGQRIYDYISKIAAADQQTPPGFAGSPESLTPTGEPGQYVTKSGSLITAPVGPGFGGAATYLTPTGLPGQFVTPSGSLINAPADIAAALAGGEAGASEAVTNFGAGLGEGVASVSEGVAPAAGATAAGAAPAAAEAFTIGALPALEALSAVLGVVGLASPAIIDSTMDVFRMAMAHPGDYVPHRKTAALQLQNELPGVFNRVANASSMEDITNALNAYNQGGYFTRFGTAGGDENALPSDLTKVALRGGYELEPQFGPINESLGNLIRIQQAAFGGDERAMAALPGIREQIGGLYRQNQLTRADQLVSTDPAAAMQAYIGAGLSPEEAQARVTAATSTDLSGT